MGTVAVTGGIGSGKSAVCGILRKKGIPVYDSDSRTKALYDEDPRLIPALEEALGTQLRTPEGLLDKARLSACIFASEKARQTLESLVYPRVKEDFLRWKEGFPQAPYVVLESAVVLSKPLFQDVIDAVVLVQAPRELRLSRVMERDAAPEEAVLGRMAAQQEPPVRLPDIILRNDGSLRALEGRVRRVFFGKNAYLCKLLKKAEI